MALWNDAANKFLKNSVTKCGWRNSLHLDQWNPYPANQPLLAEELLFVGVKDKAQIDHYNQIASHAGLL